MNTIYILYDAECGLCRTCREFLLNQPAYVEMKFIPLQFTDAISRFEGLDTENLANELHVITDKGEVYRGSRAWVMCLWALKEYRPWAERLTHPSLLPLAQRICELVSQNRLTLSEWLHLGEESQLAVHVTQLDQRKPPILCQR